MTILKENTFLKRPLKNLIHILFQRWIGFLTDQPKPTLTSLQAANYLSKPTLITSLQAAKYLSNHPVLLLPLLSDRGCAKYGYKGCYTAVTDRWTKLTGSGHFVRLEEIFPQWRKFFLHDRQVDKTDGERTLCSFGGNFSPVEEIFPPWQTGGQTWWGAGALFVWRKNFLHWGKISSMQWELEKYG